MPTTPMNTDTGNFIDSTGWLSTAEHLASPNFDQRPPSERKIEDISLLVIHNISLPPKQFGGSYIRDFFLNCLDHTADAYFEQIADMKVSSHILIDRAGHITQFVSFLDRAWHAGLSSFQGRERCNDFAIGIELEGADDVAYTEAQYDELGKVTKALLLRYPAIDLERIVGHQDIAPGRKTDPGPAFDWSRFKQTLVDDSGYGTL